jgi:isopenicillin N synthase-like dioxygenase
MPGETFAHAHADRGGFTLHLYESAGGGEYLGFDKVWRPWPIGGEETIIFPSMVLQHRSKGRLKALCHRVVATEETSQHGRFSMVVFIDFHHSHRYSDAVKRLQDFEPGFNYDLSFSEFDKLFAPGLVNQPA